MEAEKPVCALDGFFLTKLQVDWKAADSKSVKAERTESTFCYDVKIHAEDKTRYMQRLSVVFKECTANESPIGYQILAEITGLFSFPAETTVETREQLIRLNGVSILYGILRGLIANTTAMFPGGPFVAPTVMPKAIVRAVEKRRLESPEGTVPSAESE